MPYGYLGTTPNQQLNNSGVFSVEEALALQNVGELGGSMELIDEETISSGTATVDFTSIKENIYHQKMENLYASKLDLQDQHNL
mgnify:CR=1 FL=1